MEFKKEFNSIYDKNIMGKRILKEEAVDRLKKHNPNIILVDEYIGLANKTNFKCNKCGTIRFTSFNYLLDSSRRLGCVKCEKRSKNKKSRAKTQKQYELDVRAIWGDLIKIVGQYSGANNKIKAMCNKCNYNWNPEAKSLLANHGCPKCGHEKNRNSTVKSLDEYISDVKNKHGNNLIVLGKYISGSDKILIKCNICQHEWFPVARNITKGRGCPKCNLNKGETLINSILTELNLNFKSQYIIKNLKTLNNGVPVFDFVIFDENDELNIIIEFDGLQHYKPVKCWGGKGRFIKQQKVDDFKNNYCNENNIKLVRIKYTELNKINNVYIKNKLYGK